MLSIVFLKIINMAQLMQLSLYSIVTSQLVCLSRLVGQLVDRSVSQSVSWLVRWLDGRWVGGLFLKSVGNAAGWLVT